MERLERRRQYLQNKAAEKKEAADCCETHDDEPAAPKNGRKRLTALPVVS